jgi:hypothetical protein
LLCISLNVRFHADSIPSALTILFNILQHNLARTEARCRSIEKARIGAHRREAYGTFCGTPSKSGSAVWAIDSGFGRRTSTRRAAGTFIAEKQLIYLPIPAM